jgi:hypothetical protein
MIMFVPSLHKKSRSNGGENVGNTLNDSEGAKRETNNKGENGVSEQANKGTAI